jgi:hypothetical protein
MDTTHHFDQLDRLSHKNETLQSVNVKLGGTIADLEKALQNTARMETRIRDLESKLREKETECVEWKQKYNLLLNSV